jgi:hypothetical protein
MEEPNPFQFQDSPYTNTKPSDNLGRFQVWKGTFKQAIDASIRGDSGSPFVNVSVRGSTSWQNSDNTLKLKEESSKDSGGLTFELAPSWSCLLELKTTNSDFFEDELRVGEDSYSGGDLRTDDSTFPNVYVSPDDGMFRNADSYALVGLMQGDYLSIDVDAEFSNIAQLRVRIDGVDYFDNTKPNEDVWVKMIFMRTWDASYEWPETSSSWQQGLVDNLNRFCNIDSPDFDPEICKEMREDLEDSDYSDPNTQEYTEELQCPLGFVDNGYGICVRIEEEEEKVEEEEEFDLDDIEVSGMAMIGVLGLAVYIVILAIKNR